MWSSGFKDFQKQGPNSTLILLGGKFLEAATKEGSSHAENVRGSASHNVGFIDFYYDL